MSGLRHSCQMRAARGILDWTQVDLAEKSGVSLPTIKRIELDIAKGSFKSILKIEKTFEDAAIAFDARRAGRSEAYSVELVLDGGAHQLS